MRLFFSARPHLRSTPVHRLGGLAAELGLGQVWVKDETARFGLNAFKLLGARFAIETMVADGELQAGSTVVCASEGNHGRAVARAAREVGCAARVYMAADAANARVEAIAGEGAAVDRVDGTYDDAVRQMRVDAAANGWIVVSDTSWEDYEKIPRLIMLGYTRMMEEMFQPAAAGSPFRAAGDLDAVFVQGGVGGLLCAVASWCAFHAEGKPRVVSVEPTSAACLQASARAGRSVAVEGPLNTTMAGLRNREVSPLAFESVRDTVAAFVAIDDVWAHRAMRALTRPTAQNPPVAAGSSGAAALGGLLAVCQHSHLRSVRDRLALGRQSQVLVIVSEGVTDPDLWTAVTAER